MAILEIVCIMSKTYRKNLAKISPKTLVMVGLYVGKWGQLEVAGCAQGDNEY